MNAAAADPVSPALALSADHTGQVLVSVIPPKKPHGGKRPPLDICCVIDVSGSMGSEASIPADPSTGAPAESTGLSVLDVVKHALRTIISTMQEDDRIALVAFSDSAEIVAGLTAMTEDGRSKVTDAIEALCPLDCTNLWDGLKVGMDVLSESSKSSKAESQLADRLSRVKIDEHDKTLRNTSSSERFSTLFVLTDGMPNITPPKGHIPMLRAYLDTLDNSHTFNISTFGFGYSLDSPLLLEIAQVGGGGYAFIPDAGIVGTVFVHAVANAYATYAPRVKLDVEIPNGTDVDIKGGLPVTKTSWGVQIAAGDVQIGQSRDFILSFKTPPKEIIATLTYRTSTSDEGHKIQATLSNATAPDLAAIQYHAARLQFVEILWSLGTDKKNADKALQDLAKKITTSPVLSSHADALALAKDISGEGILALDPTNFQRWGRHYLPSLARSHQRQQCANFKDPGLQVYGRDSAVFIEEREKLDTAFMALPPPKPTMTSSYTYGNFSSSSAPLQSMSAYYSAAGPCFTGDCLVSLAGGLCMKVEELKRGMEVQTLNGTNKVAAVIRTAIPSGEALLCRIGDLKVTPWHPIMSPSQNTWVFPADMASPEMMACDSVYSVLLLPIAERNNPDAHSVSIDGVWCVTLGHGLTRGENEDVRSHGFLGNYEMVLKALSGLGGFYDEDGVVRCVGTRRDPVDGRICGFIGESQVQRVAGCIEKTVENVLRV